MYLTKKILPFLSRYIYASHYCKNINRGSYKVQFQGDAYIIYSFNELMIPCSVHCFVSCLPSVTKTKQYVYKYG